ncbi:hypothetical protein GBF38_008873, partial [Nibea albiflora]
MDILTSGVRAADPQPILQKFNRRVVQYLGAPTVPHLRTRQTKHKSTAAALLRDRLRRQLEREKVDARKDLFFQLWLLRGFTANTLPNVAPSGTATQSSTYLFGDASNAIDGNKNTEWEDGFCSHTYNRLNSWWSLRLPAMYSVFSI